MMRPELKDAFLASIGPTEPDGLTGWIQAMLLFYATQDVSGAVPETEDGDMLLFEWGTYDWGTGKHYQVCLRRQLIFPDGPEQDIWQLSVEHLYPPENLSDVSKGALWCANRSEVAQFRDDILGHAAVGAVDGRRPAKVDIHWEQQ